ncbi:phosphotransferase family protein [Luedemannella flava]
MDGLRPSWRPPGAPCPTGRAAPRRRPALLTVVHGDWHLGQLVARDGGWRLIDVDDLGVGPPVWDFARLAALRALGVVLEEEFRLFLDAYWTAGGPALRPGGGPAEDPAGWAALDAVTRAVLVSMAAKRVAAPVGTYPDALEGDLLRACERLTACPT